MAELIPATQHFEARLVALRDVQNNIDGLKTPMAIRRVVAEMVQEAMGFLEAAKRRHNPPPTPPLARLACTKV